MYRLTLTTEANGSTYVQDIASDDARVVGEWITRLIGYAEYDGCQVHTITAERVDALEVLRRKLSSS